MRFVDWFAGIGGFRLGLERNGFEHVASCELAQFPRRVYEHRFGEAQTFKDVTRVEAKEIPKADLWCGGFPCQDVSQAGEGRGLLGGARSGLVFRLLGLAAVARPRWLLFENVPGLLVRGRGFDRLLGILSRLGYGWAWRRLDAQYYGVAQRRKRIFLLACLDPRAGMRRAAEVLLEPESLCGNPPTRGEARARVAHALTTRTGGRHEAADTYVWADSTADPLTTVGRTYCHAGNNPRTRNVVAYTVPSNGANEHAREPGVARTLDSNGPWGAAGGTAVAYPDPAPTLQASAGHHGYSSPRGDGSTALVTTESEGRWVRRLMPIECERLQGFPDGWTDIPKASDAQRYKALGNAVAIPVVEWIGKRLKEAS